MPLAAAQQPSDPLRPRPGRRGRLRSRVDTNGGAAREAAVASRKEAHQLITTVLIYYEGRLDIGKQSKETG